MLAGIDAPKTDPRVVATAILDGVEAVYRCRGCHGRPSVSR